LPANLDCRVKPGNDGKRKMKTLAIIVSLTVLLGLAVYAAVSVWGALAGAEISAHGWIALGAGMVVTLALGAGLMFLVFYSNRRGYDDGNDRRD
jgi:hypothetical protein